MKLVLATLVGTTALVLAPSGASAQTMPQPAPEMKDLTFFQGTWSCKGKVEKTPMGPEGSLTGTVQIKSDLGGFWQTGTVKMTMTGMGTMEGRFQTTYDPTAKRFMMLWTDSMGGWAQTTSTGWQGDRMAYEGQAQMPGQPASKNRDTFTRSADGTMVHKWEAEINGNWMAIGEANCRKTTKPATGAR